MEQLFLIYDFISVVLGFSSSVYVLILYIKSQNSKLLAYLWTETFIFLIVFAIAVEFYLRQTEQWGLLAKTAWESIQFSACGLCFWIPRICRKESRMQKTLERFFSVCAVVLAVLLAGYFILFYKNKIYFTVVYSLVYILLASACLYFAVNQIRSGHADAADKSIRYINSGLVATGWAALIFLPLFIVTDFFGGFLPLPFDMYKAGFSMLPAFNLVMSLNIILNAAREFLTPSAVLKRMVPNEEFISRYKLTKREAEVTPLVLECLTYSQIGEQLCISPGTVRTHLNRIYSKTCTRNRLELSALLQAEIK